MHQLHRTSRAESIMFINPVFHDAFSIVYNLLGARMMIVVKEGMIANNDEDEGGGEE